MVSNENSEILSIVSAFENCFNLMEFKALGFNVENLKSMNILFFRSSIITYSFKDFNSMNLEKVSYMLP